MKNKLKNLLKNFILSILTTITWVAIAIWWIAYAYTTATDSWKLTAAMWNELMDEVTTWKLTNEMWNTLMTKVTPSDRFPECTLDNIILWRWLVIAWCDAWRTWNWDELSSLADKAWWCNDWHCYYRNWKAHTDHPKWDNEEYAWDVCPTWWHLPSFWEWKDVCSMVGWSDAACHWKLWWWYWALWESINWWANNGWNTHLKDAMQYTLNPWVDVSSWWTSVLAYPGYRSHSAATYHNQGVHSYYWSSTESSATGARNLYFHSTHGLYWFNNNKESGFTVRCFKD
jgi:uncharacterized protein (TIGR02145 family)